jgi:hypothetical protein
MLGQVGFESLGEFTPGQKNAPPTAFTFEADIRAETSDSPFVGAARMLFTQAEMVVETQVG